MKRNLEKQMAILNKLVESDDSLRAFARDIGEDSSDVIRWKQGKIRIHPRACMTLVRMYGVSAHDLRPDIFPENCIVKFK